MTQDPFAPFDPSARDPWGTDAGADLAGAAYATPRRLAALLARVAPDLSAPLLDFGCGTGLGGVALIEAGFRNLSGCDVSEDLLREAQDKQIYRNLWHTEGSGELPFSLADFGIVTAIDVISTGAAPARVLTQIVDQMAAGALFAFSFSDRALEDPDYMGALDEATEDRAFVVTEDMGDHISSLGSRSKVFVLEIA